MPQVCDPEDIRRERSKIEIELESGSHKNYTIEHLIEVRHREVLFIHYDMQIQSHGSSRHFEKNSSLIGKSSYAGPITGLCSGFHI